MAQVRGAAAQQPKRVATTHGMYRGNNILVSDVSLFEDIVNFRINDFGFLQRRSGTATREVTPTGTCRAFYSDYIGSTLYTLMVVGGKVYELDTSDGSTNEVATITDAETFVFKYGDKFYILNGNEFYSYDGTTCTEVEGYIPKIFISAPPAGGGTAFEVINNLTGKKRMTFSANGSATQYFLPEQSIDSVVEIYVNGVLTADYSVTLLTGVVTFTVAPTSGTDNVEIQWDKDSTKDRSSVEDCRYGMIFGGQSDTYVFLYGNPNHPARRVWSELGDTIPRADYFPALNFDDLGDGAEITAIVKQYDKQKIFFRDRAMFSNFEVIDTGVTTLNTFSAFNLNDSVGNLAPAQALIMENYVVTVDSGGLYLWKLETVNLVTNAVKFSEAVDFDILNEDLSTAKVLLWKERSELLIHLGDYVYIYNYKHKAWYRFKDLDIVKWDIVGGGLHYINSDCDLVVLDSTKTSDGDTVIDAYVKSGWYNFSRTDLRKAAQGMLIDIDNVAPTYFKVSVDTDIDGTVDEDVYTKTFMTFQSVDFANFSFSTAYFLDPFYFDYALYNFSYMRFKITADDLSKSLSLVGITLPYRYIGAYKE